MAASSSLGCFGRIHAALGPGAIAAWIALIDSSRTDRSRFSGLADPDHRRHARLILVASYRAGRS
jgi:hypothetical protein